MRGGENGVKFFPGFSIALSETHFGFDVGEGCFDRGVEYRKLDSIRKSLMDPACTGPEDVYAIMMDVGRTEDLEDLKKRMLLFGVVAYAQGKLGREPIRSQGHMHKVSAHCGWSTPEVYEIWQGKAVIYMQETAEDMPGRCYAVHAGPGDVVVVPPYWVHATVSADSTQPLAFGAWCDRDFGFVYDGVRRHNGIAFFPVFDAENTLRWKKNPAYGACELIEKTPESYADSLGIEPGKPIYTQYVEDRERFMFVPEPARRQDVWKQYIP